MPEFKIEQLGAESTEKQKSAKELGDAAMREADDLANAKEREVLEAEQVYREGSVSIRDLIAPAAMRVESDHMQLGGKFLRTIFVTAYPRYISVGWFAPIINFSSTLDIGMFFYPVKSGIILNQLKNKVGVLEAQISADHEKGAPRDPIRETALRDAEDLRDKLSQGTEKFFQFALYITLHAETKEVLNELTAKVELVFGSRLVHTRRVMFQAEQGFNSTIPLGNDELMVTFNMNSSPCASSFPFISSDLTDDDGVMYGINRHNNSLIIFDRFSLQNANFTVFATSGAGKSVAKDTEVLVRDATGVVTRTRIDTLVEGLGRARGFEPIDEELEGVIDPGLSVYTFDATLRGEWSPVSIAARKDAPRTMYTFRTKSGREIQVTGDHNMLMLRNGRVVTEKSNAIAPGDVVPVPRSLPEPSAPTRSLDLLALMRHSRGVYVDGAQPWFVRHREALSARGIDKKHDRYLYRYAQERRVPIAYFLACASTIDAMPDRTELRLTASGSHESVHTLATDFSLTQEFARLLGYIVSEGTEQPDYYLVSNADPVVIDDMSHIMRALGWSSFRRSSDGSFVIASRVFVELLRALGVTGRSHEKRVPPAIVNAPNAIVAHFLRAYMEGDGTLEKHAVSATTKSKALASDLAQCFLRFGIVARLAPRVKHATNSNAHGIYWQVTISGQDALESFSKHIGFLSERKNTKLATKRGRKGNTNCDVLPIADVCAELVSRFGPALRGIQPLTDIKNGAFQPSRSVVLALCTIVEERLTACLAIRAQLHEYCTLPVLASVIESGDRDRALNTTLWKELGASWQLMKTNAVLPRARNVFIALQIVTGFSGSLESVKKIIHAAYRTFGLSMKATAPSLAESLRGGSRDIDYGTLERAATTVRECADMLFGQVPHVRQLLERLRALAYSDLFFDPIVSIEQKETSDPYVYDLTVDNHVFLAGHGGLFVHNSYAIKLEVLRSMMLGTDVIIIDPEMEYKHLSDSVGGTYVNVSLSSEAKVNPFDLPRMTGKGVKTGDIIRSAVITVKGLLKIMLGSLTPQEDSVMDRALLETYAKKDITPDADLSKVEPPLMSDLQDILSGMEGADQLALKLKKYTEGTFSGLFNSPTNVDMRNQLVIFSVRDLEDELRPIAIYTIVNYIWNVVRSELKKRILVIDEAWWLMQHEDSAKFIFALVKRGRKYYLGITTITQDVNDFLASQYGKAILNNSSLQLLMKQTTAAIDIVQKTFLLTEGEKYLLLESGVGEGILFAGQKHAAIAVKASYAEDQLITSDPRQLIEIEDAKRQFKEAQDAEAGDE
jgi:intein/homing endonuclease